MVDNSLKGIISFSEVSQVGLDLVIARLSLSCCLMCTFVSWLLFEALDSHVRAFKRVAKTHLYSDLKYMKSVSLYTLSPLKS